MRFLPFLPLPFLIKNLASSNEKNPSKFSFL